MNTAHCVHCGLCLTSCPTYRVTGLEQESPRGRVALLEHIKAEALASPPGWLPAPEVAEALDHCLDCRACEAVCPAHVPVGHQVEAFRHRFPAVRSQNGRRAARMLERFLRTTGGLRRFQTVARLAVSPGGRWVIRQAVGTLGLPSGARDMLEGLPTTIAPGLSRGRIAESGSGPDRALVFLGCIMDAVYQDTNLHTAELLAAAGYAVCAPKSQVCCGALFAHAGSLPDARALAMRNIEIWEQAGEPWMVANAAGCGAHLKEYPDLLVSEGSHWTERAERLAGRVRDISEALDGRLPDIPASGMTVTMHDACHLAHAQGIRSAPRRVLEQAGYRVQEMPESDRCCGSAGVYNLVHTEMARTLQTMKVNDVPEGVGAVAAGNPGCILQIQAGLSQAGRTVPVRHTVDLVWEAWNRVRGKSE